MKKSISILAIVMLIVVAYSCKKNSDKPTGTIYLDLPAVPYVYNLASSVPSAGLHTDDKATLGRVLFYDTHLSLNNSISCGSCHKQALGFADNVAFSVGYEGKLTKRNSKNIANLAGDNPLVDIISREGLPLFWDGRENILQNLVARPITNHVEMGIGDFNALPAKLSTLSYYSQLFSNAYGDNIITADRISESVATFLISIQSHNSRFDQFIHSGMTSGSSSILSGQEMVGYNLFITRYHCESCHHIFKNSYTIEDFRDIGLDASPADAGRGTISGVTSDNGKFKVPNLRNVALSAPYMHDGRYKTLGDVLDHYSHGIQNSPNLDTVLKDNTGKGMTMNISDIDKQALIAFLNTFTDYEMITDPKFSNPFKVK